ncbi:MAG: hypothetical protein HWE20_09455 [Gammaproteobacteria bacterium]|nr:hypothetical protein [Gammaproteobacteria bacterium]
MKIFSATSTQTASRHLDRGEHVSLQSASGSATQRLANEVLASAARSTRAANISLADFVQLTADGSVYEELGEPSKLVVMSSDGKITTSTQTDIVVLAGKNNSFLLGAGDDVAVLTQNAMDNYIKGEQGQNVLLVDSAMKNWQFERLDGDKIKVTNLLTGAENTIENFIYVSNELEEVFDLSTLAKPGAAQSEPSDEISDAPAQKPQKPQKPAPIEAASADEASESEPTSATDGTSAVAASGLYWPDGTPVYAEAPIETTPAEASPSGLYWPDGTPVYPDRVVDSGEYTVEDESIVVDGSREVHFMRRGHDTAVIAGELNQVRMSGGDDQASLTATADGNTVHGGRGNDTITFEGKVTDYAVSKDENGYFVVTHIASGKTNRVRNFETFQFADEVRKPGQFDVAPNGNGTPAPSGESSAQATEQPAAPATLAGADGATRLDTAQGDQVISVQAGETYEQADVDSDARIVFSGPSDQYTFVQINATRFEVIDSQSGSSNIVEGFGQYEFADGLVMSRVEVVDAIGADTDATQANNVAEFLGVGVSDVVGAIVNAGAQGAVYENVALELDAEGLPTQAAKQQMADLAVEISARLGYESMVSLSVDDNGEQRVQVFTSLAFTQVDSELLWDTVYAVHTHPANYSNTPSGDSGDLNASEDYEQQMLDHSGEAHELYENVVSWNIELGQPAGEFSETF